MPVPRPETPKLAPEREMLEGWLDHHRGTFARKIDGVEPLDRLAERTVPPSSMSLLGLVRHLAEVERTWFRRRIGGEHDLRSRYGKEANPDADFDDVDGLDPAEAIAAWEEEVALAREAVAGVDLDVVVDGGRHGPLSVRWILVHMIEEYARHNGHADLLRERLDGVTGD